MKNRKKRKLKKRYWLLVDLAVVLVILVLLLYKPARYDPSDIAPVSNSQGQVSPYLTHELFPQLYDGIQRSEPFELVVIQKGINETIARSKWPKESGGVRFSAPAVLFAPESIILMGTASIKGVEFVVTIVVEPKLDEGGLLNLQVSKVKIGAMNITPLARLVARRMYQHRLGTTDINTEDLQAQIAASLLNDEPFEPIFKIDNKKVRVEKITIHEEKLAVRLVIANG